MFGPELKIVIATLKSLLRESLTRRELKLYNERMRGQIVDLEELDHDILEFRVKGPKNKELQAAMASVGEIDFFHLLNNLYLPAKSLILFGLCKYFHNY